MIESLRCRGALATEVCGCWLYPIDRCLRSVVAERNRRWLVRSPYSHPVSSLRTAPAMISRISSV